MIKDVVITEDFVVDYDKAPERVKNRLDSLANQILDSGRCPNSMNTHSAKSTDLEIGYVTKTGAHWRLLFWVECGKMYFHRLLKHDEVDIYLRSLSKGK